jgi:hypothetical protein
MNINIDKTKELLELFHPYLRWFILIMYGAMFLYVNRMFINDPVLRKWIMASFEEHDGKASGKSITSFVFAKLIAFATIVAIIYAPNHLLPEYFLISLLTFVGGLYGIKVASKYFNSPDTSIPPPPIEEEKKEDKKEDNKEDKKENKDGDDSLKKNNPDDIG